MFARGRGADGRGHPSAARRVAGTEPIAAAAEQLVARFDAEDLGHHFDHKPVVELKDGFMEALEYYAAG